MKHFLIFFLLFASSAAAQGVRFSATVTQQTTVNGVNTVTLPANPQVAFCAHPANAVPCTNKATTYTDQTLATPCSTSTQIVRDGTTTCVASPDAQNNFGFWFAPNTNGYDWTVTLPGGVNLGPFNVLSQTTTVSNAATFAQINKTCYVDGTTNTTISQALTCAGSGGSIVVPSGYSATLGSTTFVNNPVSIIIDGAQITNTSGGALLQLQASNITVLCKNNAQITLSGSGSFAFGLGDGAGSTFSNQRIEGCRINGAGTLGLAQGGFSAASALLINLQIINNTITNVNYGTVLNETTAGQGLVGPKIIGNYIKNVVGSLPGAGYGINAASFVLATGTMQYVGGIIANNYVENAGRHSIYLGFGSGWTVTGNYLKGNACISTPNGSLSVAPIGRSRGTVWSGNVIDGACDIGLQITGDNTYTNDSLISSDVTVSGNTFLNNQAQDIVIGNGAPAANGTVDHITVTGNTIYKTGFNVRGIEIVSGKQILVEGNTITLLAAGGNTSGIIFDGGGESGATNTFNDDVSIRGNLIHTAGGGTAGIQWTSAAAGSTARYDISSNRINSDTAMFCGGGAGCSDPNVTILDTPTVISGTQGFTTAILKPVIIASPILTPSALPALSGLYRLASGDIAPCWRNPGNSGDNCLSEDASGALNYAGTPIAGIFTSTNVTPVTANANTAADQNGMLITVTAGALNSIKRTLLIQLAGVYSTPAASTSVITDKLKFCTVSGCGSGTVVTLATWTTTALAGIQATNDPYNLILNATTQTAGASAAFETHGNLTIDLAALATAAESVFADGNTATVGTIDSTAQLFLQHTKAFSNASGSNSFTDRQMIAGTVD